MTGCCGLFKGTGRPVISSVLAWTNFVRPSVFCASLWHELNTKLGLVPVRACVPKFIVIVLCWTRSKVKRKRVESKGATLPKWVRT